MNNTINRLLNIIYVYVFYNRYLRFPKKSASAIKIFQEKRLKRILEIAVRKVPFYKPYLHKIDFNNFSLDEIKKLPIISKERIRENPKLFIREDVDVKKLRWKSTSGSSGKPFRVPKTYFSDAIEVILGYRAWSMGNNKYKIRERAVCLRSFCPQEGESIWKRDWVRNFWYLSPYHISDDNLSIYLSVFKRSRAKVLKGYPSSIYLLTELLKKNGVTNINIDTIITSSENMLDKYRRSISDYWKCEILDWYGQNERTVTVQQCKCGQYHNNDDYGFIEIDNNFIVATSLNNDIMPLIRYNTMDVVSPIINKNTVNCNNNMSIPFEKVNGRSDDIIYKECLTPIPTINFYNLFEKFQEIRQFQIIQKQDLSINVYISEMQKMSDDQINNLRQGILERVGGLPLKIIIVDEIVRDKQTDKMKLIKSEVNL